MHLTPLLSFEDQMLSSLDKTSVTCLMTKQKGKWGFPVGRLFASQFHVCQKVALGPHECANG